MDYETFINASFFLQGKADQFTQQRPGDRKRILSSILGLEVWERYSERAAERRKGGRSRDPPAGWAPAGDQRRAGRGRRRASSAWLSWKATWSAWGSSAAPRKPWRRTPARWPRR